MVCVLLVPRQAAGGARASQALGDASRWPRPPAIVKRNKGVIWQRAAMLSRRISLQIPRYLMLLFGSRPATNKQPFLYLVLS